MGHIRFCSLGTDVLDSTHVVLQLYSFVSAGSVQSCQIIYSYVINDINNYVLLGQSRFIFLSWKPKLFCYFWTFLSFTKKQIIILSLQVYTFRGFCLVLNTNSQTTGIYDWVNSTTLFNRRNCYIWQIFAAIWDFQLTIWTSNFVEFVNAWIR